MRFDSVLGESERAELSTLLGLSRAALVGWMPHSGIGRTYARAEYGAQSPHASLRTLPNVSRLDDPALVVFEIEPRDSSALGRLMSALAGDAAPVGIVSAVRAASSIVVELDDQRTPLGLIVDLIDVELAAVTGRRIVPLIGLDDRVLARFAGDAVGEQLDEARIIETYTEPLVRGVP